MIDKQWRAARKVLLIRLDNLGDVLLMTPAFRAVRQALPLAHLTLLASSVGAQIGHLDPDIDEVIVYAAPWVDPWHQLLQDSEREQRLIASLKSQRFDAAIIFTSFRQSALPAAYLCYLADIPLRLAASIDGSGSLLTTRHKHPERMMHEVERGLDLVGAVGFALPDEERDLVLNVPSEALLAISARIDPIVNSRPFVVIHPGCSMPARTYPWEMYAEVVRLLIEQLNAFVVLTGAANEHALVTRVVEAVPTELRDAILPLAGALSFPELCALIQVARLVITNNTGPVHIAAAVKTPVVDLFALTNPPEQWRPWRVPQRLLYHDVPCRLCYSRVCPYQQECLRLVSPEMVVSAAGELLIESGGDSNEPLIALENLNGHRREEVVG